MTREERIQQLETYLAQYRAAEAVCSSTSGPSGRGIYSNPWAGLRRVTERVLQRLYAERGP